MYSGNAPVSGCQVCMYSGAINTLTCLFLSHLLPLTFSPSHLLSHLLTVTCHLTFSLTLSL